MANRFVLKAQQLDGFSRRDGMSGSKLCQRMSSLVELKAKSSAVCEMARQGLATEAVCMSI